MSLTEFLLARIAEDEKWVADEDVYPFHGDNCPYFSDGGHWPSARVLAECEAKRRIVEAAADLESGRALAASGSLIIQGLGHRLLRILAAPCADHSDYDPVWREPT
jgi:hypothetical protein